MTTASVSYHPDDDCFVFVCVRCQAREIESKGARSEQHAIAAFLKRTGWRTVKSVSVVCATCVDDVKRQKSARDFIAWIKRKREAEARER